jgi:hypothetical protein
MELALSESGAEGGRRVTFGDGMKPSVVKPGDVLQQMVMKIMKQKTTEGK